MFDCVTPANIPQHLETFRSDIYIVMLFDFFFQIKGKVMITFKGELTSKMIFPPLIREVISIVLLQIWT